MPTPRSPRMPRHHQLTVYDAAAFRCTAGVNLGEPFALSDALCLGDTYRLGAGADPILLRFDRDDADGAYRLVDPLDDISAGTVLRPLIRLTLMSAAARLFSVRLLDLGTRRLLLPLGRFDIAAPMDIICVDRDVLPLPVCDPTTLGFGRGTRLTLSDGTLRRIEDLVPGDILLTRDGRPAPLRALLSETGPALGTAARVIIREGAFANDHELMVSAGQHLVLPGRRSDLDPQAPDRALPACRLVNGLTITLDATGQAEWFHLVLDRHDFVFAEGIPCESLCLTDAARMGLSPDLARQLDRHAPDLHHTPHPLMARGDTDKSRPAAAAPAPTAVASLRLV